MYKLAKDFKAKKYRYSANSYIEVLDDNLPEIYEPGLIFMQDNAPIYTARKVRAWFTENGVKVMEWPSYSPDLNPIKHLWFRLKQLCLKHHPELIGMGGSPETIEGPLFAALADVWPKVGRELMDELIRSMDTRINAVILAEGWYTRF